jgi:hypothetical protein
MFRARLAGTRLPFLVPLALLPIPVFLEHCVAFRSEVAGLVRKSALPTPDDRPLTRDLSSLCFIVPTAVHE